MSKRHLYILALIMTVIGLGVFIYKAVWLKFPVSPTAKNFLWTVDARVTFTAQGIPVKASLIVPGQNRQVTIRNEYFIARNYGIQTVTGGDLRWAIWSVRRAQGKQTLYYRAIVVLRQSSRAVQPLPPPKQVKTTLTGAKLEAARQVLALVKARSADKKGLVGQLLRWLNQFQQTQAVRLLLGEKPTVRHKAEVATQILALDGVPARVVHGVRLGVIRRKARLSHWLEVYDRQAKKWTNYNPATGEPKLPSTYLVWWRGPGRMLTVQGGLRPRVVLSVLPDTEQGLRRMIVGQISRSKLVRFSLFGLPVDMQHVFRVLLLVPIGAFLLVILRNFIGIATFGTFMPVLIALSFRETRLLWGLTLFTLMVGLGLAVRLYLERLKLLVVPRLAAVLIVVILLMAGISVVAHQIGLRGGLSVALFPMVILTMTIERMSVVWEERGPSEALKQGLGSLICAAVAYLVMTIHILGHLAFVFPELLLVLLAATLLLGRYSGYRLLELRRFRSLALPEAK